MPQISYHLAGGLSPAQIEQIHQSALEVIRTVGLQVDHHGVLSILGDHSGVTIEGKMVKFAPELVERAIAAMSYPDELYDWQWQTISGAYELNVTDLDDGHIRKATTGDLVDLSKLGEALGYWGSVPVRPQDIASAELQEIALQKIQWENSPRRPYPWLDANPKSTPAVAEYVYEMAQAAGKPLTLGYWIISPFKANVSELDIIYRFLDRKLPIWVATMPIMGATSPIFAVGSYVQSLAELLAGLTVLHLISRGSPIYCSVIDSVRAYPFDMKYGTFVYGSPEDIWATLIQCQLNARYKIPVCAKSLLTWDKLPGPQAAAEKAAHTIAAALAGARIFTNAGVLSVDEIYSAEQAVIDYEIVQYTRAFMRGYEFSDRALAVEAMAEVGPTKTFLDHDSTLENYRDAFWEPRLFDHRMLQTWQQQGGQDMRQRARELARRLIAEQEFSLPADVQRDLNVIYARAQREFER